MSSLRSSIEGVVPSRRTRAHDDVGTGWGGIRPCLVAMLLLGACTRQALAERRVALVMGNDAYPRLSADQQLHNAVNDARTMRTTLRSLGFDVLPGGENLDRAGMLDKLNELKAGLHRGDVAFVFYAGHGIAVAGQNYVLPTDVAPVEGPVSLDADYVKDHAIPEQTIDERIQSSGASLVVVVLDACRDDPLTPRFGRSTLATRGLAPPPRTEGLMTIHSASENQQALDRLGQDDKDPNSVFTRVFTRELLVPGTGLREAAFRTQTAVNKLARSVNQSQMPDVDSKFLGDDPRFGAADANVTAGPQADAAARPAQVAALPPPSTAVLPPIVAPAPDPVAPQPPQVASLPSAAEIASQLKSELRRAGCEPGKGPDWTSRASAALRRFNAATDGKAGEDPDMASLEAVRGTTEQVCPSCGPGRHLDTNGDCVRNAPAPVVRQPPPVARPHRQVTTAEPAHRVKPSVGTCHTYNGQSFC